MQLNLKKPIVFFDIESTGLSITNDRIIEISLHRVEPNGKEATKTYRVNPEVPISPEAEAIHGISQADVAELPPFKAIAHDILQFLDGADLGGFNLLKFDLPMITEELLRSNVDFDVSSRKIIDVQRIFHKMEQRTLVAAYKFYCDKELSGAHSAEADTIATYEVLKAQVDRYQEMDNDIDSIHELSGSPSSKIVDMAGRLIRNDEGVVVFNFGKYKGQPVAEILKKDHGYYGWMMNGDFPLYTKKKLTELRLKGGL